MSKSGKSPGIVLVNTFCQSSDKYFTGYIGYMDRPAAVRRTHIKNYDIFSGYMKYMGNPIKTEQLDSEEPERISGLFTEYTDLVSADDTEKIKNEFRKAQDNGSLMWQTVISFRNDWLEKMNVYHADTGILDEKRLKGAARKAVNKMLEKEELTNAVWTAAIHYNTDNIHIHIAAVEPQPQRRTKLYPQYEIEHKKGKWQYKKMQDQETGAWHKVPLLDEKGDILMKEEYVGKFKESSIKAAKSALLEDLTLNKDINREINEIIRERILRTLKGANLHEDQEFRQSFIEICEALPDNKGVCNYGNSAMAFLRPEIDALSRSYLEKYHEVDFKLLSEKLQMKEDYYVEAYGDSENQYAAHKMQDLYYRMGNAILKTARNYVKILEYNEEPVILEKSAAKGDTKAMYHLGRIYLRKEDKADIEKGIAYMLKSAENGDPQAQYEMGWISKKAGNLTDAKKWFTASSAQGNAYAAKALNDLNKPVDWSRGIRYSLAKNETDLQKALYWLKKSLDYEYEKYINLQDYEKLQQSIEENRDIEL